MEIHIPRPFTDDRPPVHFTKEAFSTSLSEHPLASKLPRASDKVQTFPGPRAFNSLAMGPEGASPSNLDDLVQGDRPQFSLHVSTFTDGTLVGLSHSHMTADLLGFTAILKAWCLELAGRSDEIPPLGGVYEDGMKGLYDPPTQEKHVLAGKELNGWKFGYWVLRTLWESKRAPPESRILCIPKAKMERLMVQARSEITRRQDNDKEAPTSEGDRDPYFISEGDVFAALACRLNAQAQAPGSTRSIMTMMALDPRTRAPSAFQEGVSYVGNSPTAVFLECPAHRAQEMPLGDLALLCRRSITEQATEEQMKAYSVLCAESVRSSGGNVLFGDKDMAFQLVSNWLKASLFDKVDFSPAIVEEASPVEGSSSDQRKRGRPTYYHSADPGGVEGPYMIHLLVVMGADHDGNVWLSCVLPEGTWSRLLEYLDGVGE